MAKYELRNQQTGKLLAEIGGPVRAALETAFKILNTDFPISIWEISEETGPLYRCTLVINADPKLEN